jgi:hypothetical protein
MNYRKIAMLVCIAFGFATACKAEEKKPAAAANVAGAEKVDFYAIPVPKVAGKVIKVSYSLKDKNKKPSRVKLGTPKIIFKQGDKVVHEGAMKPG